MSMLPEFSWPTVTYGISFLLLPGLPNGPPPGMTPRIHTHPSRPSRPTADYPTQVPSRRSSGRPDRRAPSGPPVSGDLVVRVRVKGKDGPQAGWPTFLVALAKPGAVAGQLSCDVEVASVPRRLLDHVQDDPSQVALPREPWSLAVQADTGFPWRTPATAAQVRPGDSPNQAAAASRKARAAADR